LVLALALVGIASVPTRSALCESRFETVNVGDEVNGTTLGRGFARVESTARWLNAGEEYHCSAWPIPKVWAIGVSDNQVVQKDVLVSP
jgi:hypothetical protein